MSSYQKTVRRMPLVIPAMILCIIGDYCIGIEPRDSETLGSIASSGWLTIADWRLLYPISLEQLVAYYMLSGLLLFQSSFLTETKNHKTNSTGYG